MATIGVIVESSEDVSRFVDKTAERMKGNNMVTNPFIGFIRKFPTNGGILVVQSITPVYFNFSLFGWVAAVASFFLLGWNWWVMIPLACVGSLGIFWSGWFYGTMQKMGLRKEGYGGSIEKLSKDEIIKMLISVGDHGAS